MTQPDWTFLVMCYSIIGLVKTFTIRVVYFIRKFHCHNNKVKVFHGCNIFKRYVKNTTFCNLCRLLHDCCLYTLGVRIGHKTYVILAWSSQNSRNDYTVISFLA